MHIYAHGWICSKSYYGINQYSSRLQIVFYNYHNLFSVDLISGYVIPTLLVANPVTDRVWSFMVTN